MTLNSFKKAGLILWIFFILNVWEFSSVCVAGGPIHGARAAAMGTAFVGLSDDLSAIAYNPAGLALSKGTQVYSGATATSLSSSAALDTGSYEKTDSPLFFPSHLYLSHNFGSADMVLGLGMFSPFGIGGRKWNSKGSARYVSIENMMATMILNPTIAWKLRSDICLGFGIDLMIAEQSSKRKVPQAGASDAYMDMDMDGRGWGYNMGMLYQVSQFLSIGAAYRSKISVNQQGDISISGIAPSMEPLFQGKSFATAVESQVTFPEILDIGLAWHPWQQLTLCLDFSWIRWSRFKRADLYLDHEIPQAGLTGQSIPLDWQDTLSICLGMEFKLSKRYRFRAGYAFIPTPIPSHTLSPANPDADQHYFSFGFGAKGSRLDADLFYGLGYFENRHVNNDVLNADYKNRTHYLGLSITYRF